MSSSNSTPEQRYPRLLELLQYRELSFKPMFTVTETAVIFGVHRRTVLKMIAAGRIVPRDLPGRARFLAADLEAYLNRTQEAR
ncbi:MAG: helix-turn-helix domain-containing protein [Terracidiphilus sp.]|jgi:excisionase family DNA binding protein